MSEKEKDVRCPHCDGLITVTVRTDVLATQAGVEEVTDWTRGLTASQVQIVERAHQNGVLKVFAETVKIAKADHVPHCMERFFLTFLRTTIAKTVPKFALTQFMSEYPGARITVLVSQGIAAVLADGFIRHFVPSALMSGQSVRPIGGGGAKARLAAEPTELNNWVRTKYGYVPADSAEFMDVLRKTAIGDFARSDRR